MKPNRTLCVFFFTSATSLELDGDTGLSESEAIFTWPTKRTCGYLLRMRILVPNLKLSGDETILYAFRIMIIIGGGGCLGTITLVSKIAI